MSPERQLNERTKNIPFNDFGFTIKMGVETYKGWISIDMDGTRTLPVITRLDMALEGECIEYSAKNAYGMKKEKVLEDKRKGAV